MLLVVAIMITLLTQKIGAFRCVLGPKRGLQNLAKNYRFAAAPSRLMSSSADLESIVEEIKKTGDSIRGLKAAKADKEELSGVIAKLLALKVDYEKVTGTPYDTPKAPKKEKGDGAGGKGKQKPNNKVDKESFLITPRNEDYSAWYNDLIIAADLLDSSPVRGCMVIKPWGMGIWDNLRRELDERITESGAQNAYFPLFIPKSFLAKEAEHVDGFAKECAVVTHHRLCASADGKDLIPDPTAELEEPLIVRPTSETIIWHMFGKWINSHRDLPLKINQWANVVRWEMRTRPFLRSAEFLWQEGHTAHANKEEAVACAEEALDFYASTCEDMLAIPCVKGIKSPSERFAGADETYTIEALMQNGWALQSGTSHFLGQNFAKAFDVDFQTENGERELVWATSWGVSTRLVGALIMTHSDDKGLVLPPPVAPVQVVIVPISKGKENDPDVMNKITEIQQALKKMKIKTKVDDRSNLRPGAKYFEWERKGVPLRLDIGPRDLTNNEASVTIRHNGEKKTVDLSDSEALATNINGLLNDMHSDLLNAAKERLKAKTFVLDSYETMKKMIASGKDGNMDDAGFYLVPWKCDADNEEKIKNDCQATIRCYPLDQNQSPPPQGIKCFYSGDQATHMAIFARAF